MSYTINVKDFLTSSNSSEVAKYTGAGQTQNVGTLYLRADGTDAGFDSRDQNPLAFTVTGVGETSVGKD